MPSVSQIGVRTEASGTGTGCGQPSEMHVRIQGSGRYRSIPHARRPIPAESTTASPSSRRTCSASACRCSCTGPARLRELLESVGRARRRRVLRLRRPPDQLRGARPGGRLGRGRVRATATASAPATGSRSWARTRPSGSSRSGRRSASARSRSCMNGWWAGDEIRYALADSDPKLLVADDEAARRASTATRATSRSSRWRPISPSCGTATPTRELPTVPDRRGRPRAHPLHERHHRPAQGRDQQPPQRDRARRRVRPQPARAGPKPATPPPRSQGTS